MSTELSQKSCDLVSRYTELENKYIQLELDQKLVQENFTKAKEEAKGMFGENLDDCPCFLPVSESDLIVIFAEKLRDALKKKDLDLAEAQKTAADKTRLAEEKLASVNKLEEENTNLKAALDVANQEVTRLRNANMVLDDKAGELAGKKNDLELYLGGLAKKLFLMLEGNLLSPIGSY